MWCLLPTGSGRSNLTHAQNGMERNCIWSSGFSICPTVTAHITVSAWEATALATKQGSRHSTFQQSGPSDLQHSLRGSFFPRSVPKHSWKGLERPTGHYCVRSGQLRGHPYMNSHACSKSSQNPVLLVSNDGFPSLGENHSTA